MSTQNLYKVIIQGKLDFGNDRSYQKVLQLYAQRAEVLYKKEIVFKQPELIFFDDEKTMVLNRYIGNISEEVSMHG